MSFLKGDISDRPVLSIPVSQAEKRIFALCWLALASSLVIALLAMVYLPERPVVHAANGSGPDIVRDKYALIAFCFFTLGTASLVFLLPKYPLHRSTYVVIITPQNAEAQYKLGRYLAACFYTSLTWWFVAAQTVSLVIWLSGRENPALETAVLIPMAVLPLGLIAYWVAASRKLG